MIQSNVLLSLRVWDFMWKSCRKFQFRSFFLSLNALFRFIQIPWTCCLVLNNRPISHIRRLTLRNRSPNKCVSEETTRIPFHSISPNGFEWRKKNCEIHRIWWNLNSSFMVLSKTKIFNYIDLNAAFVIRIFMFNRNETLEKNGIVDMCVWKSVQT